MQNTMTKAWELYEKGRAYNNSLEPNQYSLVNTNIAFYQGNQWLHMPDTRPCGGCPSRCSTSSSAWRACSWPPSPPRAPPSSSSLSPTPPPPTPTPSASPPR